MLPGPDRVLACPGCSAPVRMPTLLSGNTIGGVLWSDGKVEYPMLPMDPEVSRCQGCSRFFWLAEATELGEVDWMNEGTETAPEAWQSAPQVEELTEGLYLEALAAGVARNEEEEMLLRIRAWWAGNDLMRGREGESEALPNGPARQIPGATRANLERLLALLGSGRPEQILMQAEILRELERFDDAREILTVELPDQLQKPAQLIRLLIDTGSSALEPLTGNAD